MEIRRFVFVAKITDQHVKSSCPSWRLPEGRDPRRLQTSSVSLPLHAAPWLPSRGAGSQRSPAIPVSFLVRPTAIVIMRSIPFLI